MKVVQPKLLSLGAICLFLAIATVGAGCSEEPANVDPQAVLNAASAKMKEIAGFHFAYEVHQPETAEKKNGIVSITGDINAGGDMQATVEIFGGGVLFDVEFIALGDTHYVRYPLSEDWLAIPAAESPVGTLNLATGTIRVLDNIVDAAYEGTDKKSGTKTYHISGIVAATEVEAIAGSTDTEDPFPTDIWIGIDDDLVYEVDIIGPAQPSEDPGVWRSIVLNELEVALDIQAPQ
jgi:hypothetical protein